MSAPEDRPEPDRIDGAPHPRETARLYGQDAAEAAFLSAHAGGRMHHAWLVTGPRGVGKATFAWRAARFLLTTPPAGDAGLFGAPPPPESLDIDADHPVARRMRALSEPRLFLLRRPYDDKSGRLKQDITVDEARRLKSFFQLSATDGGARAAIVDAADDLNPSAANALLKLIEEPPEGVTFFLVCHQPAGLLPTIRSRCRDVRLGSLSPADLARAAEAALGGPVADSPDEAQALAALAAGSVGEAIRLHLNDGTALYRGIVELFAGLPRLDRPRAIALADKAAARGDEQADLVFSLSELFLARLARTGATGTTGPEAAPGEAALFARLAPSPAAARGWAELAQEIAGRLAHGRAVNLDPAALLLDMVFRIDAAAGRLALR